MWYNINFLEFVHQYLLVDLRKYVNLSFYKAVINPIVTLHYEWKQYRAANMYKLAHNGQVCYLRGALNDRFDPELRRIYIDGTGGDNDHTYVYTPAENQTKYLGTLYLRHSSEFQDNGVDFIVFVPTEIAQSQPYELRALIDFYRIGGKRYTITEI